MGKENFRANKFIGTPDEFKIIRKVKPDKSKKKNNGEKSPKR